MTKKELLSKTKAELVDLGVLKEIKLNPKWTKGRMVEALLEGEENVEEKKVKEESEKEKLERLLKEAQQENRMLKLEQKVYEATKEERTIRDFGEIVEPIRVRPGEEMVEFTPQIDPTSKKKKPYHIFVMIDGVGFGTNKGEKFLVPKRLAAEVYRLINEGYGPGAVTIPNPTLE